MRDFPFITACTIAALGIAVAVINPPSAEQWRSLVEFTPELTPLSPVARHVDPVAVAVTPRIKQAIVSPLLDDDNGVLDAFYRSLRRTANGEKGAVTRVVHYGDSPTTADLITGDIRTILQARYGNAGHGFILPGKPWAWYQHTGVRVNGSGWQMVPASHFEVRDGFFGLGGVSFTGGPNAESKIVFEKVAYNHFEIWFLRQKDGGTLTVTADGAELAKIDTSGDDGRADFAELESAAPASTLELHVSGGRVRLFGVTAENAKTGVVYDSIGLNGASVTVLSRMFNAAHWTSELQHRRPDLVIINYGTNEADFADFIEKQYEKELREAVRRVRAALPQASILIMSPMDRGKRVGSGAIETMPTIPRLVEIQRRVARETGCGFFSTYQAMGGEGTIARWYASQPRLVSADFIHPYPAGGKIIAGVFTREITSGLNRYQLRESQKSLSSLGTVR
jgi:lysophospholipase L1-like esterase